MDLQEFKGSIDDFVQKAIDIGLQVSSGEITLVSDISAIDELDTVIDAVHNLRRKELIDDNVSWNISVTLGTLLGEMIIKENGFHWAINSNDIPVVETEEKNQLSPITKIYKILLDNKDEEGSAKSFYNGFKALQAYDQMSDEEKERITKYI